MNDVPFLNPRIKYENGCYAVKIEYPPGVSVTNNNQYTLLSGPHPDSRIWDDPAYHRFNCRTTVGKFWYEDGEWYPMYGDAADVLGKVYRLMTDEREIESLLKVKGFHPMSWRFDESYLGTLRVCTCMRDMKTTKEGNPAVVLNVPFQFFYWLNPSF